MDMIQNLYTVRDCKAEYCIPPFVFRTDFEAQRAFADSINKEGTTLHDHPEDFYLYRIGSFDSTTGVISPCADVSLGHGLDFVRKE